MRTQKITVGGRLRKTPKFVPWRMSRHLSGKTQENEAEPQLISRFPLPWMMVEVGSVACRSYRLSPSLASQPARCRQCNSQ